MNLRSNLVIVWRKICQYVVQYDVAFYCGFGILITIACSFPSSRSFILYHLRNVCCCRSLFLSCWGVIVFLMHILFKGMHLLMLCQEVSQHTSTTLPSPSCILGENNFWWRFLMWLIPQNLHQYTHHDTGNGYHASVLLLSCREHVYQMFMEFSPISASPDMQVSLLSWYSARTKFKNKRLDPLAGVWHWSEVQNPFVMLPDKVLQVIFAAVANCKSLIQCMEEFRAHSERKQDECHLCPSYIQAWFPHIWSEVERILQHGEGIPSSQINCSENRTNKR